MPTVSFKGRNFNSLVAVISHISEETLEKVTDDILRTSQELVPVRTGALKESAKKKTGSNETTISYGNEAVVYPVYVEYGTRYMRAQPYLRPAIEAVRGKIRAGRIL